MFRFAGVAKAARLTRSASIMASLLDLPPRWYQECDRRPRILLMVIVLRNTKEFLALNPRAVHRSYETWDQTGVNEYDERLSSRQTLHSQSLPGTEAEEESCPDIAALLLDELSKNRCAFTFGRDPSRCDVLLPSTFVSRVHFEILPDFERGSWMVQARSRRLSLLLNGNSISRLATPSLPLKYEHRNEIMLGRDTPHKHESLVIMPCLVGDLNRQDWVDWTVAGIDDFRIGSVSSSTEPASAPVAPSQAESQDPKGLLPGSSRPSYHLLRERSVCQGLLLVQGSRSGIWRDFGGPAMSFAANCRDAARFSAAEFCGSTVLIRILYDG